ncbi:DNA-binding LacI/PurR family transcriptional regulator [Humitalea rosea]|uniref:DNA-binding LacI/PurR family transcriptional regulator n=1 Tax=Humitalea rosea TaxID=990373 RepID=A0A2W7I7D8_9PROT|nr:LacI family DNA-binding transcriptional regulator [Humitalea rosea]PZW41382.1 DNA-binding LacI/PurR family transcriptional regulator [Humitalea rosea]
MSQRRPVTAQDVARLAGVSQSAVSRCFTPGASAAPQMRERVEAAARSLGYRPNLIARSLITRRSRIIGVALGYLHNQFYPAVLEALSEALQAIGYQVLLFTAPQEGDADPRIADILRYQVDGLVLASASLSSRLAAECRASGVPVVLFNRTTAGDDGTESVSGDNEAGAAMIAAFLVAGGHRRLAYVAGLENSSTNRDRQRGFCAALAAHGLAPPRIVAGGYDHTQAQRAAALLFASGDPPDAVFCANDHMALAVMDAARHSHGLRVPDDVSIIGFDDTAPASWPSFSLTSFSQPVAEMVAATVGLLVARLADPDAPARQLVLPGALVVRGSARLPARGLVTEAGRRIWRPQ